ncbi:class D sortase [Planococcus salinarum]|uniref:class D sortase n=1 Tax=Planococcus salinarum TaxID=622695 RepID=UPI000E3D3776|nr:class D sortase [Planococcus salinarum]TAA73322.1 class D sortase [Planococcus salinarum]
MNKKRTKKNGRKKIILSALALSMIVFGLWFSSTNAASFLKGYMIFKSGQVDEVEVIAKTASSNETISLPEQEDDAEEILYPVRPEKGENIGNLLIPKIEATLPIFHGSDEDELAKGVGHFADSVLPGENDNSVLSGHMDTVFRRLGEVGKGDLLTVETSAGTFTYKVRKTRIVDADDRTVIVPKPKATLTVSTCYPFDFIGSDAPERFILIADLVSKE